MIVWDSGSTDGTQDLAAAAGAQVRFRAFDNYAAQRQAAVDGVDAAWILFVDADERVTPAEFVVKAVGVEVAHLSGAEPHFVVHTFGYGAIRYNWQRLGAPVHPGFGVDDRAERHATLITAQLPVEHWHGWIGEATIADAILDRLLHHAHRLTLKGESLRRTTKESKARADKAPIVTD